MRYYNIEVIREVFSGVHAAFISYRLLLTIT